MKLFVDLVAPTDGTLAKFHTGVGQSVTAGQLLAEIDTEVGKEAVS